MPMSLTYFKSALVAYVVITLVRHVSKASATEEMEMLKQVDEGESLVMDINWVIQMTSFGFSGFFCELLGLSSGLKAVFPELRVTKALARNALVEPLVGREGADIRISSGSRTQCRCLGRAEVRVIRGCCRILNLLLSTRFRRKEHV